MNLSRSHFCRLALLLVCSLLPVAGFADDKATIRAFVQDFYKRHAGAKDPEKWIMKSDQVTRGFKSAYAAFMKKGPDYDPIIQGQDVPASGYHAGDIVLDGNSATATMITRDKGFPPFKVHLVREGAQWRINGVNGLKGK